MKLRREVLLTLTAGLLAVAVIVTSVFAEETFGVITHVAPESKKVSFVTKRGEKIELEITDRTEIVNGRGEKIDLEAVAKAVSKANDAGTSYDLGLMPALKDAGGMPTAGRKLIIVAAVNDVLHFRIFDDDGHVVVDIDVKSKADGSRPTAKAADLRKVHESWRTSTKRPGRRDRGRSSPPSHRSWVTSPA